MADASPGNGRFRFFPLMAFGFTTGSGFSTLTGGGSDDGGEGERGGSESGETEVMSTDGERSRVVEDGELGATESSGGGGRMKWKVLVPIWICDL